MQLRLPHVTPEICLFMPQNSSKIFACHDLMSTFAGIRFGVCDLSRFGGRKKHTPSLCQHSKSWFAANDLPEDFFGGEAGFCLATELLPVVPLAFA